MRFKFKIQDYQTQAVESTVEVFNNQQVASGLVSYRIDTIPASQGTAMAIDSGYRNHDVSLSSEELLDNIQKIQKENYIPVDNTLSKPQGMGACALDIEMETGTGKTYVYIKTIFELNKKYGWSKFIIVVPSIAIREGVKKSFEMLEDHFMLHYQKKAKYFIYDSKNLTLLRDFELTSDITVMIINTQAFSKSPEEDSGNIIYTKRDEFNSNRPIDVISANRPIIIMDEPQKMGGASTQEGIKRFKPLFILNYSATHKTKHNTIFALDPLDAFKQKLVKKIKVKGFEINNLQTSDGYLYLDEIILSPNEGPKARIEIETQTTSGVCRKVFLCRVNEDLFIKSNNLNQYKNFVISNITDSQVEFINGIVLTKGVVIGDKEEETMQRIQIRETIKSHFEKEQELFSENIKTLSLFFIDKVEKYKQYDENGNEIKGFFPKVFEEEYNLYIEQHKDSFSDDYKQYLGKLNAENSYAGYFSIDKKNHIVDSKIKRGQTMSDDISAYDLILKNKEKLLSFSEPTRFIFSHSALREGWDNPNVFQICLLKHLKSGKLETKKELSRRQEIGRGLRLSVNQDGNRMDYDEIGDRVHKINELTVIANESFGSFISTLQKETSECLRERPWQINEDLFVGKTILDNNGEEHTFSKDEAESILSFLKDNYYLDDDGNVSEDYKKDYEEGTISGLSKKIKNYSDSIYKIVMNSYDRKESIDDFIENGHKTRSPKNTLNKDNLAKQEWKELWDKLKNKYTYLVSYDSEELIEHAVSAINKELSIAKLSYTITQAEQDTFDKYKRTNFNTEQVDLNFQSSIKYDLVGEIAKQALIRRRTAVSILQKIDKEKFDLFKINPEQFIKKVVNLIKEQKSTMIIAHLIYNKSSEEPYDINIFTKEKHTESVDKTLEYKKHITKFLFTDGLAEQSVEKRFADDLEKAEEVCVYAKLPKEFFYIPTPIGHYTPDWAIAFKQGKYKHLFFIAETKGNTDSMQLRTAEKIKIESANRLFNILNMAGDIQYHAVATYRDLLNQINK